jgi:hypothetical protein
MMPNGANTGILVLLLLVCLTSPSAAGVEYQTLYSDFHNATLMAEIPALQTVRCMASTTAAFTDLESDSSDFCAALSYLSEV